MPTAPGVTGRHRPGVRCGLRRDRRQRTRGAHRAHHALRCGHRERRGQCIARRERVALDHERELGLLDPGQRIQRQSIAHRRIAGDQVHALAAEVPRAGDPAPADQAGARFAAQRQHVADGRLEPLRVDATQAIALEFVGQAGVERIDVDRQLALAPEIVESVFEAGLHRGVDQAQLARQRRAEALRIGGGIGRRHALVGEQARIGPARLAVGAPADRQRPARQLLARIPLALAVVQETAGAVVIAQPQYQLLGAHALGGAQRVGVPFGAVAVVDADEGGLAAHRQADIARHELGIDPVAEREHGLPLLFAVRKSDSRRLPDSGDTHVVAERHLGLVDAAADGCGAGRLRRAGERDVAFAGQQAGGGVEADPAGAGQVDLAPGVQVGEVDLGAAGAVERLLVGRELDQVARHEPRGQAQVAQHRHHQPAGIAARAGGQRERLFRRLHARLHADQVADVALDALVQRHHEVHRGDRRARDAGDELGEPGRGRLDDAVRGQLGGQRLVVGERELLGAFLQEEVERVVDRHLGDQIDGDLELARHLREHQAREVVRERILLPVDEVVGGFDLQRVRQDRRAAVGRRAQADDLRAERDESVVLVVRDVVQCDVDGQGQLPEKTCLRAVERRLGERNRARRATAARPELIE
jgi:hypothetical protein